jgi:phospholipid/cholesterol/gamma-HCH transport system substrate-binding protein
MALGLGMAALVILLIGKERQLFEKKMVYRAAFENVDGLKLDYPVRLGGLDVGRVTSITFSPDLGDKRIQVQMEVSTRFAERVRTDSVARVTNRGVLGDKAIDISLGNPEAALIPDRGEIQTGTTGEISQMLKTSAEILDNTVIITRDLKTAVAAYTEPELRKDVSALVRSARTIVEEVEKGNGVLHALVYDKRATSDVRELLASLGRSAARVDHAISQVEDVLKEIREGNGPAHALIYDQKGAKAFEELGRAASQLSGLVDDAQKSPNGAVHQLIYGDARGIFGDLGVAASDLKQITAQVKAGKGSLGAIINDPTLYEDMKILLGNVKRNRILKELVRYSISASGENVEKAGKVTDPGPPPPPAPEAKQ